VSVASRPSTRASKLPVTQLMFVARGVFPRSTPCVCALRGFLPGRVFPDRTTRRHGLARLPPDWVRLAGHVVTRRAHTRTRHHGPPDIGPSWCWPPRATRLRRGAPRGDPRNAMRAPLFRPLPARGSSARGSATPARGRRLAQPGHRARRRPWTQDWRTRAAQGRHAPCRRAAASGRGTRPMRPPPPKTAGHPPGRTRGSRRAL